MNTNKEGPRSRSIHPRRGNEQKESITALLPGWWHLPDPPISSHASVVRTACAIHTLVIHKMKRDLPTGPTVVA